MAATAFFLSRSFLPNNQTKTMNYWFFFLVSIEIRKSRRQLARGLCLYLHRRSIDLITFTRQSNCINESIGLWRKGGKTTKISKMKWTKNGDAFNSSNWKITRLSSLVVFHFASQVVIISIWKLYKFWCFVNMVRWFEHNIFIFYSNSGGHVECFQLNTMFFCSSSA